MAVNRKPGSPNNLFSEDEFGLADVGKLIRDYAREPAELREMRMRLEKAQTGIAATNTLYAASPAAAKIPAFAKAMLMNQKIEASLLPRIGLQEASKRERTSAQAVNSIGREFSESSINSYISRNINSMNAQGAGWAAGSSTSYSELKRRQASIRGEMGRVRARALNSAENLYDEEGNFNDESIKKMHKSQVRFKGLANELTQVAAGLNQFKHEGRDPQGRLLALTKATQNAAGVLNTNSIEEQMKNRTGLGALSPADLKQRETEAATKLIKAMDQLRNSFGKGEEVVEKFSKSAEEAAKELEEVQEAQGMGGKGGGRYDSAKIIAGAVMEALNNITTGFQNVAINQPMQMVSNVQGAANIENEKYSMWHSALSGDMSARMTLGGWDIGNQFGVQQAGRQNLVHGGKMVTNTIGTLLGGIQLGEAVVGAAGEFLGNSRIEAGAQGAKNVIGGLVGGIEENAAMIRNTDTARLRIDATHAVANAVKAVTHISGRQFQGYRDYAMGLNTAAGQMGGDVGEAFLNQAGGANFLDRMQNEWVGLKEMGTLSTQGASQMGSMFKANQVIDAVHLENLGHGSAAQNMQRMGILGAAGMQNPSQNLSKIIEEGMQRGLNSSKAIDMIVENTARMTEENVKMGGVADPTAFLTRSILNAIDKNNPNKELAGQIAYQTYQSAEGARHNISASFPGMINIAGVEKDLGLGFDRKASLLFTQMPTMMLNSLSGKSADALKNAFEARGVRRSTLEQMDPSLFQNGKIIDVLNKRAGVSEIAMQSGAGYASALPGAFVEALLRHKGDERGLRALISGNDPSALSESERNLRADVAFAHNVSGRNATADISNVAANLNLITSIENAQTLAGEDINSANTSRGAAQYEKRLGERGGVLAAIEGAKGFGADAGGEVGIKNLAETGRKAFEKAGQNAEAAWTGAASKTAENFGVSSMNLNKASGKLETAADNLIRGTDAMRVVSESFGAMMRKWTKAITEKTSMHVDRMKVQK